MQTYEILLYMVAGLVFPDLFGEATVDLKKWRPGSRVYLALTRRDIRSRGLVCPNLRKV